MSLSSRKPVRLTSTAVASSLVGRYGFCLGQCLIEFSVLVWQCPKLLRSLSFLYYIVYASNYCAIEAFMVNLRRKGGGAYISFMFKLIFEK